MEKKSVFISVSIQTVFALMFLSHRNPDIHWCAIAPLIAAVCLIWNGTKSD